jgi:hypothetical protein
LLVLSDDGVMLELSDGAMLEVSDGAAAPLVLLSDDGVLVLVESLTRADVLSELMPASDRTEAVSPEVVPGAWPMVLSVCAAREVSAATAAVVSPRSGAAPTSSEDRLWHAAREAAAANVKRYLMDCSSAKGPCPLEGLFRWCPCAAGRLTW